MIRKSVTLAVPPAKAFALFTERMTDWWPADRRHTGDAASALFITAEGRFWERARDGREVDLGRVRVWDPPARLVFDFYVGTDAAHPTEVEVEFAPDGDRTRVTVTHRPTDASAALWDARAPRYDRSWDVVLEALASANAS